MNYSILITKPFSPAVKIRTESFHTLSKTYPSPYTKLAYTDTPSLYRFFQFRKTHFYLRGARLLPSHPIPIHAGATKAKLALTE